MVRSRTGQRDVSKLNISQKEPAGPGAGPDISVIIVNFNGGAFLQAAVDSLKAQTYRSFELILVDNDSTDGSLEAVDLEDLPDVLVMAEKVNHGFAHANNLAAAQARGEWLALLNPDAVADANWLAELAKAAAMFPEAAMFASAQISLDEPDILDGAGDCYSALGFAWRGGHGRPLDELPETGWCFAPCGAGAFFNRSKYLNVGGFDERYFCYFEDVDLAFRFRLLGETCLFWRPALLHHYSGGISVKVKEFAVFHGTRNRFWTFVKNMPAPVFWAMLTPHLAMTFAVWVRGIATGRARAVRRGFFAGVAGVGPVWRQRRQIQRNRKVTLRELLASMSRNPIGFMQAQIDVRPLKRESGVGGVMDEVRDSRP